MVSYKLDAGYTAVVLTRLESQRKDMYFDYVSLKRMVIDEIQLTRHISQVKGIGFDVDFKVDDYVYTDIKWCRMIIRTNFVKRIEI